MDNAHISKAFVELADLLELSGESAFKIRAYREFAETAAGLEEPLAKIAERGALLDMEGVGKAIAGKVDELLRTGTCDALEKVRAAVPATLRDLLRIQGLGAKSVQKLWSDAKITTLGELAYACEENRIALLPGFGAKKQEKILAEVRAMLEGEGSMLLAGALELSLRFRTVLEREGFTVAIVGEARRGVDVVRELIVLVRDVGVSALAQALGVATGELDCRALKVSGDDVVLTFDGGARVRVRGVPASAWVLSVIELSAAPAHSRWLEARAAESGGLLAVCARATREEDVYEFLGLPVPPPELRDGPTPTLPAPFAGVRGIFHVHTDWSDGAASIVEMAREAAREGFTYIGISDHSRAASYANGLDAARLAEQARAVDIARREVSPSDITILHGVEVDILDDGSLDLDDETLSKLDFVIASVHTRFNLSHDAMTARIVRAVSHPLVTMLGHPTGRLLLARKGYTFDIEAVARAASANDTYLEINANAQRLDLSDMLARRAAAVGGRFVINPDAHTPRGLADTALGVTLARRAGLVAAQVLNARGRDELTAVLAKRKAHALTRVAAG